MQARRRDQRGPRLHTSAPPAGPFLPAPQELRGALPGREHSRGAWGWAGGLCLGGGCLLLAGEGPCSELRVPSGAQAALSRPQVITSSSGTPSPEGEEQAGALQCPGGRCSRSIFGALEPVWPQVTGPALATLPAWQLPVLLPWGRGLRPRLPQEHPRLRCRSAPPEALTRCVTKADGVPPEGQGRQLGPRAGRRDAHVGAARWGREEEV